MSHIEYADSIAQQPIAFDRARLRCLLYNARHMLHSRYASRPNWSVVVDLFGVGSSKASDFCLWLGVDPDARAVS